MRVTLGTQGTVTQAKESTETLSPLTLEQQVCEGTQSEDACAICSSSRLADLGLHFDPAVIPSLAAMGQIYWDHEPEA